jgi:hypothetical protein
MLVRVEQRFELGDASRFLLVEIAGLIDRLFRVVACLTDAFH